jgi:hypothetical protein
MKLFPYTQKDIKDEKCPFIDGNGLKDVEPSDSYWNYSLMTVLNEQIVNILARTTELA